MYNKYHYPISISGGLMLGVGVPILFASFDHFIITVIALVMIILGGMLSFSSKFSWLQIFHIKLLLTIHILLAASILALVVAFKPHIFLIGWAVATIIMAILGWYWLPEKSSAK